MGVVRDVTIDQLTRAVQGISSNGISDSTGQAINNTLGTLGKDTTLQSIINAINGLGQTLGSDKANIDGSNIANPSAFRQSIGIKSISVSNTSLANNVNVPNLNTYRFGIFHLRYSANKKWYAIPFDVANIPSEGINLQVFVNNNLYIVTVNVIKATNTIYMSGFTGIDDKFITLYY